MNNVKKLINLIHLYNRDDLKGSISYIEKTDALKLIRELIDEDPKIISTYAYLPLAEIGDFPQYYYQTGEHIKQTPLHYAALYFGCEEILKMMLAKPDIDVNIMSENSGTPLHRAVNTGNINAVKILVEAGANVNATNDKMEIPLHLASEYGHLDIVKFLLEKNAVMDVKCAVGSAPLHRAAYHGHFEIVKILVEKGCDINITDRNMNTSLHYAVSGRSLQIVDFLLMKGIDFDVQNKDGRKAFNIACGMDNNVNVANSLFNAGADIESRDNQGDTPLHCASFSRFIESVKFLLDKGAHVNAINKDGKTPIDLAIDLDNKYCDLLKERMNNNIIIEKLLRERKNNFIIIEKLLRERGGLSGKDL